MSLTTCEGDPHTRPGRAHTPLLSRRRTEAGADPIAATAAASLDDLDRPGPVRSDGRLHHPVPAVGGARPGRGPGSAPILVDIRGIGAGELDGPDLSFGYGAHYCVGVHPARLELRVVLEVLRDRYPAARLAVGRDELRQADPSGTQGSRLTALPVLLR